jgi:serine/threonine-protein kinase
VKIADFGLARPYKRSGAARPDADAMSGTVPYMAPEQIAEPLRVGPASDLYAVGATLYRLLSGSYPHDFPEGRARALVVLTEPIVPLRSRSPEVPAKLAAVVERALDKDPARRFASAAEMQRALAEAR